MNSVFQSSRLWLVTWLLILGGLTTFHILRHKTTERIETCQELVSFWTETLDQIESPLRLWQEWGIECLHKGFQPLEINPDGSYKIWVPTHVNYVQTMQSETYPLTHPVDFTRTRSAWVCRKASPMFTNATPETSQGVRLSSPLNEAATILFVDEMNLKSLNGTVNFHITKSAVQLDNPAYIVSFEQDGCQLSKKIMVLPPKSNLPIYMNGTEQLAVAGTHAS